MQLLSATTALLCLAPAADAFVVAPPLSRVATVRQSTQMVAPLPSVGATSVLQSMAPLIAAAGTAEPGTVDAPGWVLPVGAFAVILTAGLIPLLLKVRGCPAANMTQDVTFAVRTRKMSCRIGTDGARLLCCYSVDVAPELGGGRGWRQDRANVRTTVPRSTVVKDGDNQSFVKSGNREAE